MAGQADKGDESLVKLLHRIGELEERVAALEHRPQSPVMAPPETFFGEKLQEKAKRKESTSAIPVLGKAVLAIAGAYLLRAMAESGAAPPWLLRMLAIIYAGAWLVTASRSHRKSVFASTIFALTAAAILVPLLWEGAARFHDLTAGFTSMVLYRLRSPFFGLGMAGKAPGNSVDCCDGGCHDDVLSPRRHP